MVTLKSSIEISRPVGHVFTYAGDYRNDIFWRKGVILLECQPSGMPAAGTTTRETMLLFGNRNMTIAKVTEFEPCKRTAFEALHGPIPCHGYREFEETDTGTRVTYSLTLRPGGWRAVIVPFLFPFFSRQIKHDLLRLRMILEREQAVEAARVLVEEEVRGEE